MEIFLQKKWKRAIPPKATHKATLPNFSPAELRKIIRKTLEKRNEAKKTLGARISPMIHSDPTDGEKWAAFAGTNDVEGTRKTIACVAKGLAGDHKSLGLFHFASSFDYFQHRHNSSIPAQPYIHFRSSLQGNRTSDALISRQKNAKKFLTELSAAVTQVQLSNSSS